MKELFWKVAVGLSLVLLWGCEHKELCYDHAHSASVRVLFDWSQLEEHLRPANMRVAFYPMQGGDALLFDFSDQEGGSVNLPVGAYRVLCYNNDTEWIDWQGESDFLSLHASTDRVKAPDGTEAFSTPDFLCVDTKDSLWIQDPVVEREQWVRLTPRRVTSRYSFEVNGLKGLDRMVDFRATLSEMSVMLYVAHDSLPADAGDPLLFGGQRVGDQLRGRFFTFGYSTSRSQWFTLYVRDHRGKVHLLRQDVGEQVRSFPREGNVGDVHLVLRFDFTLPTDSVGGGFEVDADEWEDVLIDIDV